MTSVAHEEVAVFLNPVGGESVRWSRHAGRTDKDVIVDEDGRGHATEPFECLVMIDGISKAADICDHVAQLKWSSPEHDIEGLRPQR